MKKLIFFSVLLLLNLTKAQAQQKLKTENVILITLDGFRWQELFLGADSSLMKQQKSFKDNAIKEKFWRDDVGRKAKGIDAILLDNHCQPGATLRQS